MGFEDVCFLLLGQADNELSFVNVDCIALISTDNDTP